MKWNSKLYVIGLIKRMETWLKKFSHVYSQFSWYPKLSVRIIEKINEIKKAWHLHHFMCCLQKSTRDREFEALQGKVQRLEKLRRALKVERNELNKKVQNLSGRDGVTAGASDQVTDSPSPPPTDSLLEPSSHLVPDTAPCSQSCHCDPQLDTDALLEEAKALSVAAQEWSDAAHSLLFPLQPPNDKPPACKPLLLCRMKLI